MINGKKILVVLPAYNAGKTLKITYDEIDRSLVDDVILVVYYPDKDSDSDEKLRLLAAHSHTESAGTAHGRPADDPLPKTP